MRFFEAVAATVASDSSRIWTFGEGHPARPSEPPVPPAELGRSGAGVVPQDPANSAAIADGSSAYPRAVFDRGFRYDESYPFGNMWYLWGKVLAKARFRISFSDATFVWHHVDSSDARMNDVGWHESQLECNIYVLFVNCLWVDRSATLALWAAAALLRSLVVPARLLPHAPPVRLSARAAVRLLRRAWTARRRYRPLFDRA